MKMRLYGENNGKFNTKADFSSMNYDESLKI